MTRVLVGLGLAVLVLVIIPVGGWGVVLGVSEGRPFVDEHTVIAPAGGVTVHASGATVNVVSSRDAAVHVRTTGTYVLSEPSVFVGPDGPIDLGTAPAAPAVPAPPGTAGSGGAAGEGLGVSVSGCLRCDLAVTVAVPPSATVGVDGSPESITAVGVDAPLRLSSGSGPITARDLGSPRVEADTGRGTILVALRRPATVLASSGRGDVTVSAPPTAGYALDPQSGGGTVELTLPDSPGAPNRITVRTGRGAIVISPSGP